MSASRNGDNPDFVARVVYLKRRRGLKSSEIAAKVNLEFGTSITDNAVNGIVFRDREERRRDSLDLSILEGISAGANRADMAERFGVTEDYIRTLVAESGE